MANGDHDNGQTSGLLANTGTVTIDTTAGADIQASAEWGIASASNTVTAQKIVLVREDPN